MSDADTTRHLEVVSTRMPILVEDLGRHGFAHVGVSRSGAADRSSLLLGNRLLHNDPGAAGLEITFGSAVLRIHHSMTLTLTGAPAPATLDGIVVPSNAPFHARSGQILRLGLPPSGLRTYLCVRGGIDVPPVLGSRSADTLSGIGPAALTDGDSVPIGPAPHGWRPKVDLAPTPTPSSQPLTVRVLRGPRDGWIADFDDLLTQHWTVSADSNRVGMRLTGQPLARHESFATAELPSEGVVRGSIQVPSNGQPVVFLADHPVTGGYPVVAVLADHDCDRAAQARPGQQIIFTTQGATP